MPGPDGPKRGDLVVRLYKQQFELRGPRVELRGHLASHLRELDQQVGHLTLHRALLRQPAVGGGAAYGVRLFLLLTEWPDVNDVHNGQDANGDRDPGGCGVAGWGNRDLEKDEYHRGRLRLLGGACAPAFKRLTCSVGSGAILYRGRDGCKRSGRKDAAARGS